MKRGHAKTNGSKWKSGSSSFGAGLNLSHCLWTNVIRLLHDVLIWDVKERSMKHQHMIFLPLDMIVEFLKY